MNCHQRTLSNPSRRNFLMYAGTFASLSVLDPLRDAELLWASDGKNYYLSNRERFTAGFEKNLIHAKAYLKNRYGAQAAQDISTRARHEFTRLLPEITDIGGDRHPGTKWMLLSAHWIAFLRPMKEMGYSAQSAAQMMYDLYVGVLEAQPRESLVKRGQAMFTQKYMDMMQNWAEKSKNQQIDWVAEFVAGDGTSFDWGIDYLYCPCLDFFKTQNAADMAPYFCLVDFPEHQLMGTGLVRTKTLAQGDDRCTFRYKQGRAVTQDWASEVEHIQARM